MPKIKDLPKFERPREKLQKRGTRVLHKKELLAIILRTGTKGKSALQIADDILLKYGDKKLVDVSYNELRNMHGVGPSKAAQVIAAIELGKRLYKEKVEKEVFINSPEDILAHNHPSGDPEPSEDDIKITKQLTEAGKIMGIDVLDHIIITKNKVFSFKEKGLLT